MTVKPLISALEQCSKTICNKLTESDSDKYGSLLNNLKVRITELEAATETDGRSLSTSESTDVQAALIVTRG